MPIGVNYGPTDTLGGMMYGAGQNLEQNERLQQLMQWLAAIRGQNLDATLERERHGLQRELYDKGQATEQERMEIQREQFAKELAERDRDRMIRAETAFNNVRSQQADRNSRQMQNSSLRHIGVDPYGGRQRTFMGVPW